MSCSPRLSSAVLHFAVLHFAVLHFAMLGPAKDPARILLIERRLGSPIFRCAAFQCISGAVCTPRYFHYYRHCYYNYYGNMYIYIYIWPFSVFKKFRHSLSATMRAKGGRRSCASFHLTSTPERHLQPKYGLLHAAQAGCLRCVKLWENYGVDLRSASDTDNTTISPALAH